jgi:hypothetical protein
MQPHITHEIATSRIAELHRLAAERNAGMEIRSARGHRLNFDGLRRYFTRSRSTRGSLLRWSA